VSASPPANELLEGVWDVLDPVGQAEYGELNEAAINTIRIVPGRGALFGERAPAIRGSAGAISMCAACWR